jgi:hypothetical protein
MQIKTIAASLATGFAFKNSRGKIRMFQSILLNDPGIFE